MGADSEKANPKSPIFIFHEATESEFDKYRKQGLSDEEICRIIRGGHEANR